MLTGHRCHTKWFCYLIVQTPKIKEVFTIYADNFTNHLRLTPLWTCTNIENSSCAIQTVDDEKNCLGNELREHSTVTKTTDSIDKHLTTETLNGIIGWMQWQLGEHTLVRLFDEIMFMGEGNCVWKLVIWNTVLFYAMFAVLCRAVPCWQHRAVLCCAHYNTLPFIGNI